MAVLADWFGGQGPFEAGARGFWFGFGFRPGFAYRGEADYVADGVEQAVERGDGGQEFGHAGFGEEGFEQAVAAVGFVLERVGEP